MTPSFLFPICDDCGETLSRGGASHVCITPNSRSNSAVASASNPSISSRQARSASLGFRFPVMPSSPSASPKAREAEALQDGEISAREKTDLLARIDQSIRTLVSARAKLAGDVA